MADGNVIFKPMNLCCNSDTSCPYIDVSSKQIYHLVPLSTPLIKTARNRIEFLTMQQPFSLKVKVKKNYSLL